MLNARSQLDRVIFVVTVLAAALIHISIAASQVLLGLGVLLFLVARGKLFFPRIWIPLAAFFLWTALADVLSPDPWGGRAQIRKFFVFLFLPLVYSVFREQFERVNILIAAWVASATASGILGLYQFVAKYRAAGSRADFYVTYVGHRITGFESHWMTFGALQLSVLSLLLAAMLFSRRRIPLYLYGCVGILTAAIVLGETRSIWIATVAATVYLLWCWRPRAIWAIPVLAAVVYVVSPDTTRERFRSVIAPHGDTDSNRHRYVTFRTGIAMIEAHPIFGLGPEQIRRQFDSYVPADIERPLPNGFYGHLHNIYVQYAAERGIPALLFLLWLIGWTLVDSARAIRNLAGTPSDALTVLHGSIAVIVGVLVGGLFEHNLGDSEVLMMFASVLGLAYAAVDRVKTFPLAPAESQSGASPVLDAPLRS